MKNILLMLAIVTGSVNAFAGNQLNITESREAGFLYGFLSTIEDAQNAGDDAMIVSADVTCSKIASTDSKNPDATHTYECPGELGGISGEIAQKVYDSFSSKGEENFENIILSRKGQVACSRLEPFGKKAKYTCW